MSMKCDKIDIGYSIRLHPNVVEAGIAQRQTASAYLKQLCTIGLLHEIKAGREKIFVNSAFLKLLTQR